MMRIAVCDDTPMEADFLQDTLVALGGANPPDVRVFGSGETLLAAVEAGAAFDLCFLDIVLPGMDGLELARVLRRRGDSAPIAFLTNSGDRREEALTIHGGEYLIKPLKRAALFQLLASHAGAAQRQPAPLVLDTLEGGRAVPERELIAVQADGDTLTYRLTNGREWRGANQREQFPTLCSALEKRGSFFKTNRNTLISAAHIEKLERGCFQMSEGLTFPIPRLRYNALAQKYLDYLARLEAGLGR